jgi:predicted enzyme related to lactoylglutathione lyase
MMPNKQGEYIWYELMTPDIEGARAFYAAVVGWKIGDKSDMPGMDYRMINAPDAMVGGIMPLNQDMIDGGGFPIWIGYVGVNDVDATAAAIKAKGGTIHLPPFDIPGVGRLAMASDPQGAPFYVMRGAVEDGTSTAFAVEADGHCEWNELSTTDQKAAHDFYESLFGWTNAASMPMGAMGDYRFLYVDDLRIGATVEQKDRPALWRHYFHVPSIAKSAEAVKAGGGSIDMGPHEVPGGGHIIIGTDPQGAQFALSGPL